jgi:hypothetical protein
VRSITARLIRCLHDINRRNEERKNSLKLPNEFYRMNMPFELGIEYGCRYFASDHLGEKRCLILERPRHDYMKSLSDLSGIDIKSHTNDPPELVRAVRSWFIETVGLRNIDSATVIWYRFTDFMTDFYETRTSQGFSDRDLEEMPVVEFIHFIQEWLQRQPMIDATE